MMAKTPQSSSKTCTNKGCGKSFTDDENGPEACQFHPSPPVFHEGLKGWSCCKKRVMGFDEFLEIPGCSNGPHSDKKSEPEPKATPATTTASVSNAGATKVEVKDGVEVYQMHSNKPPQSASTVKPKEPVTEVEDDDPEGVQVPAESKCKRSGCGYTFKSNDISRGKGAESTCSYHPGKPVFHEGSKGWSCCSRKVLEFDEFLKIKGCKVGKHLFVGSKPVEEFVQCRHDWYQSPNTVTISIYAKNVVSSSVQIQFESEHLKVDFQMPNGQKYRWHTTLFQPIDTGNSKFHVLGTKVEIILKKSNGISWPAIEPTNNVKTWTTFGIDGKTGTIGGKEMYLSKDAPVFALKQ